MPSLSKIIKDCTCNDIIHKGTCREAAFRDFFGFFLSSAKFFLPIAGVPLLMKIKNLDRESLLDGLKYYAQGTATAFSVGYTISLLICLFRNLRGNFKISTLVVAPCTIAGLSGFFMTPRLAQLFSTTLGQVCLEAIIRQRTNILTRKIADSKFIAQTLLFMCCSATIMTLIQKHKFASFWFVRPSPKARTDAANNGKTVCSHASGCTKFCLDGMKSHFLVGISLEFLKILFNKVPNPNKGILKNIIEKFKTMRFETLSFLLSYMAIYRVSSCVLNNYCEYNPDHLHTLASFLGGASYLTCPKMGLMSYGMTMAVILLWKRLKMQKKKHPKLIEVLKKCPFDPLMIMVGLPYIVGLYVFRRPVISPLGASLINGVTNNKALYIWKMMQPYKM